LVRGTLGIVDESSLFVSSCLILFTRLELKLVREVVTLGLEEETEDELLLIDDFDSVSETTIGIGFALDEIFLKVSLSKSFPLAEIKHEI
jgi:hypothetical protein